jgi:hypothetical protein
MRSRNEDARPVGAGPGAKDRIALRTRSNDSTGRYAWRRDRGLLTASDLVRRYLAMRNPRGPYRVPLPGDLIGREVA